MNITGTREDDSARGRRSNRPEQAVLLRRGGPDRANRTDYIAPNGFPLQSLGIGGPGSAHRALRGQGHVADRRRPSASTCRSSAIRRMATSVRSGTRRCCNPDTAAFSTLDQYGGHNQTVRYEGAINKNWLIEGSFARAANNIVEIPSVDQWSVTDDTVTPHQPSGRHRLLRGGQRRARTGNIGAKATNLIGAPSDPVRHRRRAPRLHQHDQPHRVRPSRCRTGR